MGKIGNQQPLNNDLLRAINCCPNCGAALLMFGCDNPRCENYQKSKRFFYHEIIKTQAEIDKEYQYDHHITM